MKQVVAIFPPLLHFCPIFPKAVRSGDVRRRKNQIIVFLTRHGKEFFFYQQYFRKYVLGPSFTKPFDASPHISNASAKAISNRYVSSLLQYNSTTIPIKTKASDMAMGNKRYIFILFALKSKD